MNKLLNVFMKMDALDDFAIGKSWLHRLHPLLKLICSFLWIVCVLTTFDMLELLFYILMVVIIASSIHLSIKKLVIRGMIGLPFSLCLGLSYILINHQMISIYGLMISQGLLLCMIVFVKTFLCLCIAYLLICTTPFHQLASELVYIKVPSIFVLQLTMTYRYIFVFLYEAQAMSQAYLLRSPKQNAIAMKDMGRFVGHLLILSMNQSQYIYDCMKCRGFDVKKNYTQHIEWESEHVFLLMIVLACFILMKVVL